ncbi:DNA excision repair protein ERCC-6-like [Cydia pomonella]|uniref:DNA excision repair protein ERCC-6-like n=1 Tax=Cydia pomonella TaxID=82600 RepID=UPI002ADDA6CB|nr:DNA excision repair protein ERCC-6-like [Cydia pomonella]
MVDINKYLESQLALAKQKCDIKASSKKSLVSEKSKVAAELISKKQDKTLVNKKCSNSKHELRNNVDVSHAPTPNTSAVRDSDEGSEYLPSGEDEEEAEIPNINIPAFPTTSRTRQNVKKIIDDGDTHLYNERLENWKKYLSAARAGNYEGDSMSADINYVLDGHKDVDELHELQNGLNVPTYIWKQLYKYQKIGVKWLWELHQVQSGGLLGDEMGLGKTVQIIAFLAGLSKTHLGSWGGLGPSIIVAPATVIFQWVTHFHYWCPYIRVAVLHHSGSHSGNHNRLIRDLHDSHGILLITYAGVVKYSKDLMVRKWHYIILDEGHKIRNPETQVSKLVKKFQTPHKILITGSPMQNSLQELWSLFDFMRPGLLGTYNAFMEHFAQPITQGGYANATEFQEATAFEIAKALKNMITPYMLRRTKAEVQEHIKLPEKNEQVLFCALSQEQRDLYMGYLMSSTVRSILDKESRYGDPLRARVLVALSTLRKICNHPDLYLYEAQEECEKIDEQSFGSWKRSGKMTVVHSLLKIWQKQGHRALIFSQSRAMLCLLEQYLQNQDYKYLKMDGTVSVGIRQNLIKNFNENPEYLVFLATTRVGGLGVNLTGADRVIIYDPDWNPATDSQAKERAWRIGQQRKVTVYRLLSGGTIEEKIYQRQIFKHFLSNKILIDPNQKNVLTTSTLQGLFTFDELNCEGDTETAALFKHTKVSVNHRKQETDKQVATNSRDSISKKKLEEMRRQAREISRKIASNVKPKITEHAEDPREKYKKKRDLLINPPVVHPPEINLIDDKVTNVPFDSVLSELDIINMHSKKDYEENLLKEALKVKETELEEGEVSGDGDDDIMQNVDIMNNSGNPEIVNGDEDSEHKKESSISLEIVPDSKVENEIHSEINDQSNPPESVLNIEVGQTFHKHHKSKRKRKHSSDNSEPEIENLIAMKKVKKKKSKKEKEKLHNDDDYVLSKLFAKAGVKNALQHDVVVGLAEKEKRHRLKEEATKKARHAVRAVKFSTK